MESKNKKPSTAYERARKRVDDIKGFYGHLTTYVIVSTVLLLAHGKFHFTLLSKGALGDPEFLQWLDWNVYGTPIIWGIGILIHGLIVFVKNPFLGKAWEKRQIEKYINQDKQKQQ